MNFLELAKTRYSVRGYLPKPVEPEKLAYILECGRVAPTGVNAQPQRILVVQTPEGMEKMANAAGIPELYHAPMALIICVEKECSWTRKYDGHNIHEIDATIVTDHMILAATEQGLGTLWMCRFKPEIIRAEFNIPDNYVPVNVLLVGYTDPEALYKSPDRHDAEGMRKPIEETVTYDTF
ncbi:MAG: nitroreductase family protein [Ruminococcus sp.]|nr:nitroreductase family protein [Ruminococcus sp.]